jgi:hypothetical protein
VLKGGPAVCANFCFHELAIDARWIARERFSKNPLMAHS